MFQSIERSIFRFELSSDLLEINNEVGYFRNNNNSDNQWIKSVFIINPSNSTDWTVDTSCFIKYAGYTSVYQEFDYVSVVTLDKFEFSLDGEYCNPPINYVGNQVFMLSDRIIDEGIIGGKEI